MDLRRGRASARARGPLHRLRACLDSDALEAWPEFFVDDCRLPHHLGRDYDAGMPLGLIYCTSNNMLKDRVSALREANIYEPQRYRHLISNIHVDSAGAEALDVSRQLSRRAHDAGRRDDAVRVGRYLDRVVHTPPAGGSPARSSCSTAARSTRCWRSRSDHLPARFPAKAGTRHPTASLRSGGSRLSRNANQVQRDLASERRKLAATGPGRCSVWRRFASRPFWLSLFCSIPTGAGPPGRSSSRRKSTPKARCSGR